MVIKALRVLRFYDNIEKRSSHILITLRGGGLSFVLVLALFFTLNMHFGFFPMSLELQSIFICSFVMGVIGFVDDSVSLPALVRLAFQFGLVIYPAIHFPLLPIPIPAYIQYPLYCVSWVWFINLFNFMDGTNGFACQEAVFLCLCLILLPTHLSVFAAVLLFSVLGFLPYNFPKAKVFMGDVGSVFLGYLLGGMLLLAITQLPHLAFAILSSTLVFTADASYTLIIRILRKQKIWEAHRTHWYQRVYNMGYTHNAVFFYGFAVNLSLLLIYVATYLYALPYLCLALSVFLVTTAWSIIYLLERTVSQKLNNGNEAI
jgi:Fuc2NAc and GlcNAc transferase